jgi:hypothetical protein
MSVEFMDSSNSNIFVENNEADCKDGLTTDSEIWVVSELPVTERDQPRTEKHMVEGKSTKQSDHLRDKIYVTSVVYSKKKYFGASGSRSDRNGEETIQSRGIPDVSRDQTDFVLTELTILEIK